MSDARPEPKRGRPKKKSAQEIRDVAMHAYWRRDPADVSVNAICQAAHVSKPSVYREFGSEDGLMCAVLDTYAEQVLSDVFGLIAGSQNMAEMLQSLAAFASADPRMETGCLFHKMRAGKHRLGPKTRAKVEEIGAAAQQAFREFLRACRASGDWAGTISVEDGAGYLVAQLSLAFTQRSVGEDKGAVRRSLDLALSVFDASAVKS